MFVDVDEYIHVMSEMQISANQFLLCYLLYTDQRVDGKLPNKGKTMANFYRYTTKACAWKQSEVDDLIEKGYVIDEHRGDKTHPDYLTVTDLFVEKIFIREDKFNEFWDEYPFTVENFHDIRGPRVKLKSCDRDAMKELYTKKVRTKVLHEKIIKIVKWARDNNQLNIGLEKFLRSHQWEAYEEQMNEHTSNMHAI